MDYLNQQLLHNKDIQIEKLKKDIEITKLSKELEIATLKTELVKKDLEIERLKNGGNRYIGDTSNDLKFGDK